MAELKNMSVAHEGINLNTVRDQLKIRISEHDKRKFLSSFRHVLLAFFTLDS